MSEVHGLNIIAIKVVKHELRPFAPLWVNQGGFLSDQQLEDSILS